MATLTSYPVIAVCDLKQLQWKVVCTAKAYGEAAVMTSAALQAYDESIDDNKPYSVRNNLWGHYQDAKRLRDEARQEWDEAKALLLSVWN